MTEETENGKLDEPIKVRFTGAFRQKFYEHSLEFDGSEWTHITNTLDRQKTNIVVETVEEANALISKLKGYENGRVWMTTGMNKCATRVREEIESGLEMEDEKEGNETESETEHEEPSAQPVAADGGEDVHAELVGMVECSECGMNTLNETLDGWVCMACNTTFESDRFEREELVADGGMPPGERDFIHGKPEREGEDEKKAMTDGGEDETGDTTQCEECGDQTPNPTLTADSHPVGPNQWVCEECTEVITDDDSSERAIVRECDWCDEPADLNKDIYYACNEHESNLTELVKL